MVTATIVRRMGGGGSPPVGRHVEVITLAYATHATIIEADVELNGTILHAYIVAPALDGSQYTFSIDDEDNTEVYTSGLLTESTTAIKDPGVSVAGTITLKLTAATTQLADREFRLVLIYV